MDDLVEASLLCSFDFLKLLGVEESLATPLISSTLEVLDLAPWLAFFFFLNEKLGPVTSRKILTALLLPPVDLTLSLFVVFETWVTAAAGGAGVVAHFAKNLSQ